MIRLLICLAIAAALMYWGYNAFIKPAQDKGSGISNSYYSNVTKTPNY
jgi:amino acid permease